MHVYGAVDAAHGAGHTNTAFALSIQFNNLKSVSRSIRANTHFDKRQIERDTYCSTLLDTDDVIPNTAIRVHVSFGIAHVLVRANKDWQGKCQV